MSKAADHLKGAAADFNAAAFVPRNRRPPAAATSAGSLAEFSTQFQQVTEENERLKAQAGVATELSLELIDDSPHQKRTITQLQVQELADNLANNPLSTPVVVRRKSDGRYELISGHRRVRAFRFLGRTTIPAVIREFEDELAHKALVFDNLLPPELPDFDKYLTLKSLQDRFKWSYASLSEETGLSKPLIGFLFAFGKLPSPALEELKRDPSALGATAAALLAKYAQEQAGLVTSLVQRLVNGEIKQSDLKGLLSAGEKRNVPVAQFPGGIAMRCKPKEVRLKFETPLDKKRLADLEQQITKLVNEFFAS